jgi:hypothetical protein
VLPLLAAQDRVIGVVVDRAVPNRQAQRRAADPDGLFEQFGQPPRRWPPVRGERWLQVGEVAGGGVSPRGDDAWVVVPAAAFVVLAWAEQVVQQSAQTSQRTAFVDFRDQLGLPKLATAAAGRWA